MDTLKERLDQLWNEYDTLGKTFMAEKYVMGFLLWQPVASFAPFDLEDAVARFVTPCNPGPLLTQLQAESACFGLPTLIYDGLYHVLAPVDPSGKNCVLMLVDDEIQRIFRLEAQSDVSRALDYLWRMRADVTDRLRDWT